MSLCFSLLYCILSLASPDQGRQAYVLNVTDGDTVTVRFHDTREIDRVRFIGVNTPEMRPEAQCYASEASDYTRRTLYQQVITLYQDNEKRDKYGRYLAYAWYSSQDYEYLFNWDLLYHGLGRALVIPPNIQYESLFKNTEREARSESRGLHTACATR